MSNSQFTFKQFCIKQEHCAMKVGTDGCLLGAWADFSESKKVLDIGSGSGLIAIMAAQRCKANIIGIEIDSDATLQAKENAKLSPWSNRIDIINCDIKDYITEEKFDTIVSNPPFFSDSLKCSQKERNLARHDDSLACNELMECAARLLTEDGKFSVVIPNDLLQKWCDEALYKGLSATRITYVHTLPHKPAKRVLIEFSKKSCLKAKTNELILEDTPGKYSADTINLLRDFYLKL
ncbi:MAG: methyltransferase [Bacteroidaceae bacterium]|nr:methyltransferase [Bacteroidaceae bacterium]